MTIDKLTIARAVHEAIRAHNIAHGDDSIPAWDAAPDWQKDATFQAVEFHVANPDAPASRTHDDWMANKIADGWVLGEVKDAAAKTHPMLIPYEDLPAHEKAKDYIVSALVRVLST